ncbi:Survival factor 1 [Geosmithia morbida]|uniref:Survival factor 1 n=1 Tax=Geosmithia morbida TaxID=1094350 RepID=A0A9P4Z0W1_9HYPO|nr:Survival factor 1 [Geosmithia morbida]KAF4126651.1 Survival factor 1 [Geosmithia morbida]
MFNWAKQQLANVAGTQEPIYGPSAIRSVAEETAKKSHTELTRDDIKWQVMDSTNVETQTFYIFSKSGRIGMAQVIYSNVAGIRVTAQFNVKVFSTDASKEHLWCSTPLQNIDFSDDKTCFYATDCALELSEDGTTYTIKSMNDERGIVNLKVTRTAPGIHAGETGKTLYGTDLNDPWGYMRHAFWPRCVAEGTITTKDEGALDFAGQALYAYAIQGMKPHHAAARWNFLDFQGPNYSAVMMEFTTPPSYGATLVNVGAVLKDGKVVTAGSANKVTHTSAKKDEESEWPEPTSVRYVWSGKDADGNDVEAVLEDSLGPRIDRVDVMAEVPGFVKKIVAGAAGTKPYIYQYTPKTTLKVKVGDNEESDEGQVFTEATFISETE